MRASLLVIVLLIHSHSALAAEKVVGNMMISSQLNEWCMSEDSMKQQFCQAYLFGIYETTDCVHKIETPSFVDLKTTFVTWLFSMGDDAYVYAVESALASFKNKYGCN
jgi:hypothetical protein